MVIGGVAYGQQDAAISEYRLPARLVCCSTKKESPPAATFSDKLFSNNGVFELKGAPKGFYVIWVGFLMQRNIPTIKEIAERLNVSVSTVSRALNDHPRIGLRTKTRVQELAKQLNYEPNSQAIYFKQRKTYVIGVVIPFIREEFFSQAISGIETAAMEHHYTILFGQSHDEPAREKAVVDAMKRQRVDGLIISLSKHTRNFDHLSAVEKMSIPVVYFDRVPPFKKANKVYCNLYSGTVELIQWLLGKGYRRIALINGPDEIVASKERFRGYIDALAKNRLKVNMAFVVQTDFSKQRTITAVEQLISLKHSPDAIISFNDYVHMDAVQFAHQQGIKINKDIAFASYANLPITEYTAFPPLVSLEQFPYLQGEKAMQMMIRILNADGKSNGETVQTEELSPALIAARE
jgi:LacI family transcriptional regulator, repressor for deo operon, udp, cdd, tsx, nupC, and nupG